MLEQTFLSEHFESILDGEMEATQLYSRLADTLDDPSLRDQVQQVLRDKQRHVELAQRLLEIVG